MPTKRGRSNMKLKSIRAYGFKSFADKIDIELKSNITAIVGPNGSGKSNIVDAVRWVLGEQSVKSLRGSSAMSDVIFAGSETRSPLKRCEVALTFDNTDHFLNTDLTDVEVKRILYHTGENEYYINNAKVRLKDITNLFLDSGIGVDSFNIISQGNIESIVNSKPYDRRVILESAAGVLKYKNRKNESVRKLDKTKDNLEKVALVTDELALTVEPLKEQSAVAKKFLEYKRELEDLEISLTTYDITHIHDTYNVLLKEVKDLESQKETLEFKSGKKDSETEKLKVEQLHLDEQIAMLNQKLVDLNEELAKLNSEKTLLLERQKYEIDQAKIDEDLMNLKETELAIQKELAVVTYEVEEKKKAVDKIKRELGDLEERQSLLTIQKKHLDAEYDTTSRNQFILRNKINLLEANLEQDMTLPTSVKNVINHPRLKGILGTIGKVIDVPSLYTVAIDIALGASSNFIITEDEKCASMAVNYLKENHLGRATFFPLNIIKERFVPASDLNLAKEVDGYIGIASDLIAYDSKYTPVIKNQLGNVLVVKNIETMNKLGKALQYRYRIVTLEGEILHAGGSITGGSLKRQNSTLKDRQDLANLKIELENNEYSLKGLEKKKETFSEEERTINEEIFKLEKEMYSSLEIYNQKENARKMLEEKLNETSAKIKNANMLSAGTIEASLFEAMEKKEQVEIEKTKTTKMLEEAQKQKSTIASEIASLENAYREQNSAYHKIETELKSHEIEIGKLDTKMDYLLNILSEEYHITYEKAKTDYLLDLEPEIARSKVSSLKKQMKDLGEVNLGSIAEYDRIKERYEFLTTQKADLEKSCDELYKVIAEMDEIMKEKLVVAFTKIESEFQKVFKKMFKGGTGLLKLTDPDNILETGIEIIAEPPGKKLNNIQLLSGGEKTLTAISLLFAILNVYPVPFCILDEVEAALDEANVDTFGAYLQEQKEKSEFLLITHKKRTMEYATTLYGITMQEQGVSKIVSVKLEEDK